MIRHIRPLDRLIIASLLFVLAVLVLGYCDAPGGI